MTKKEKIQEIASRTGYSESHISKVLSGSRYNQTILDIAEEIDEEEVEVDDISPVTQPSSKLSDFTLGKDVKRLNPDEIGDLLKKVREERGLSQEALADRMGISRSTVSAIENDSANCKLQYFFDWFVACRCIVDIRLTWA